MLSDTDIRRRLPHRYPCLLLDRVLELDEERAVGYKNVTANEPHFRGHFPEAPLMPGVLIIESLFQLAWVMHAEAGGLRLAGLRKLRFRRPVRPGDRLDLEVRLVAAEGEERRLRATARVEGQIAAEGELRVRVGRHPLRPENFPKA